MKSEYQPDACATPHPQAGSAGVIHVEGRTIHLRSPDSPVCRWIGQKEAFRLLTAAWLRRDPTDPAMSPVLVGPPGCGKTTLACAVAAHYDQPIFLMNCSADMRPEDLLVIPVLASNGEIRYQASGLVSAALTGGICVLDEANRMNEKAWASLASLLDDRRYVDSVIAGVKLHAAAEFRLVATMNNDSSTFSIPAYIESRLRPVIRVERPGMDELAAIVQQNVPGVSTDFRNRVLARLDELVETGGLATYSIRDAIQICRFGSKNPAGFTPLDAIQATLGLAPENT